MKTTILIVDDEPQYRQLYTQILENSGYTVLSAASAEEAMDIIKEHPPAMVITDVRMKGTSGIQLLQLARREAPALPFLLVTAYANVKEAVNAMKIGAVDYLSKPVDLDELIAAVADTVGEEGHDKKTADTHCKIPEKIIAESPAMKHVLRDAYRVSQSDASVLLTGESGSGKEVIAGFIHENSRRKDKSMVTLNCAAVPATLLSSELFGHEKGAFTGASAKRKGRFREAHESTLFLDEIGDMPLELQPALLRALETGKVTPLGSDMEIQVDYRLIAATNHDLQSDVNAGRFRLDLFYRLNVIAVDIPPLRERSEDILPLCRFYLSQGKSGNKRISRAAAQMLCSHPWPGNVRELTNAIEHVKLMAQTDVILPEHLPLTIRQAEVQAPVPSSPAAGSQKSIKTLEENEIDLIRKVLEQTGGNRTKAAALLGITRRGLIYKLKRLGIG